ncbi:PKD domain-containing protein [Candidatus Parcubacteria bacterium]|nr:MAG: PKD domain-containing protein [Candidatus Parcubacteria bacterium]
MKASKQLLINTALIAFFLFLPKALKAQELTVVINEIGAYQATDHEWIEILNVTGSPVDLSGWKFWENQTNHGLSLFQGADLIIGVAEYAIIAQKADIFHTDYPDFTGTIIDSSWGSLKEDGEEIGLKDAGGSFIEQFTYTPAPDFSLERTDSNLADYTSVNWHEHSDSNTAGMENSAPTVNPPVDEISDGSASDDIPSENSSNEAAPEIIETGNTTAEYLPSDIVVNEFMPDPGSDDEEWIELYSNYIYPINLSGWTIEDGTEKPQALSGSILPRQFTVLENLNFQLNNAGDIIVLNDANGKIIDQVSFGAWDDGNISDNAPKSGSRQSLARNIDGKNTDNNFNDFSKTSADTKGLENIISFQGSDESTDVGCEKSVIINEVFPDPRGSDADYEWIELKNLNQEKINLKNWVLKDAAKTGFTFAEDEITAGGFIILKREFTKIALNNSGSEKLQLLSSSGCLVSEISYEGKVVENTSYALNGSNWTWTESPTPGAENIIKQPNQRPIAVIDAPGTAITGETVLFDASDSSDPNNDNLAFRWDFGDGVLGNLISTKHTYDTAGNYLVKLTVTDDSGAESEVIQEVNITKNGVVKETRQTVPTAERIIVSEIFPNPSGSDDAEFIELYNPTPWPVDLSFWQIDDSKNTGKPYKIPLKTTIEPRQFLFFEKTTTGIILNNDSDSVRLSDPVSNLVDQIKYQNLTEGHSLAIDENYLWQETSTPTPGEENKITFSSGAQKASDKFEAMAPADAQNLDSGEKIKVIGTVTAIPGLFSSQYFYIDGLQIYSFKKDFPSLAYGDKIEVSGEISKINNEKRLKIKSREDIKIIAQNQLTAPLEISVAEITEEKLGMLLKISGEVTDLKGSLFTVDDGTEEIAGYLKNGTGIKKDFKIGDTVNLTGIISGSKNGLQILPRSQDDIVPSKVLGESNIETTTGNRQLFTVSRSWFFPVTLLILAALILWQRIKIIQLKEFIKE